MNSTENYVRFHLVSLLEQMRQSPNAAPLRVLLLGCTHYPYLKEEIRQVLAELYAFREGETYRYRHVMAPEIALVDPAENVAEELYAFLHAENLLHPESAASETAFYISIPNTTLPEVQVDAAGRFPYAYKYGREAGENKAFVQYTPFSPAHISADTYERWRNLPLPQRPSSNVFRSAAVRKSKLSLNPSLSLCRRTITSQLPVLSGRLLLCVRI
ncbi:Asp/Glu/hydantoin racemase [Nitritalea halalkaliphila LW7]|uniref:Asp/Glu/hydantoin racemase n=1 Tax=Nitritalea halalkaliphila LW7 TaxID=1189621 RepID=I5BTF8_9BACT|nr:Asp/Glu/hydantoin racemase [Nitritalea halalkaliphila LW7]